MRNRDRAKNGAVIVTANNGYYCAGGMKLAKTTASDGKKALAIKSGSGYVVIDAKNIHEDTSS